MLLAEQPGVPHPIKLQEQHRALFPEGQPITEESGDALGRWARGVAVDWPDRIAKAETRAQLEAIAQALAAAPMSDDERKSVRAIYSARWNAIAGTRTKAS
jgi:hypothetical protein